MSRTSADIAYQDGVSLVCKSSDKPHSSGTKLTKIPAPFLGMSVKKDLCEIVLVASNTQFQMQKTLNFCLKNVNFRKIYIKNDEISILLEQKDLPRVEKKIAKLNQLLK